MNDDGKSILDFIPKEDQLRGNIYILITCKSYCRKFDLHIE